MKTVTQIQGFTLAEMLISMAGSAIIIGALLFSSIGLQRAFRSSELYAAAQADQRRLLDYLTRDLRRAVGIATSTTVNGSGATKVGTEPVTVEGEKNLLLSLPGYYKSNAPESATFDDPLPVVVADRRVDYGTETGQAPSVAVIFRKVFLVEEGCVCFVRQEGGAQTVIVRHAEDLSTRITLNPDGTACTVEVWFTSPFGSTRPLVAAHDQIMLRNNRID
jgi:type II secretory pathway pseudopilin PulG